MDKRMEQEKFIFVYIAGKKERFKFIGQCEYLNKLRWANHKKLWANDVAFYAIFAKIPELEMFFYNHVDYFNFVSIFIL